MSDSELSAWFKETFSVDIPKACLELITKNPETIESDGRGGYLMSELGHIGLYLIRDWPDVANKFNAKDLLKSISLGSMDWMNRKELSDAKSIYALINGTPLCRLAMNMQLTRDAFFQFLLEVEKLTGEFNRTAYRCSDQYSFHGDEYR